MDVFDLLVSKKADITLTDDDNKNLLDVASCVDDLSLLLSIVPKFDINSRGKHGWTPLMKAAVHGNIDVFHLFFHTVNVNLKLTDDNNNNLLHLACYGGNLYIVKLLLPKFDINSRGNNGWTSVMFAADKGVESVFKLLVSKGADLRLRDDKNNYVLHLACFGGNISIVRDLLACTCTDINSLGSHGRTAIMITAFVAEAALFQLLLSKKANITLTDDDNNTVLHHACNGGDPSIVNYLIPKFNINASGKHGWTPGMFAAWAGRKVVFDLLVKKNADLTLTDDYNDNVLHLACQGGSTDIVECLVNLGDVNRRGKNKSPQAMHVGQSGKGAIVKQESGYFDINVRGRDEQTLLMRAVCGGHMDVYIFLVSYGADQTLVDKNRQTLLHLATKHGQLDMVKCIIDSVDINAINNVGLTSVMTSVLHERVDVFGFLRKQGADLTVANNAGEDVATLAHKIGCSKIIEQLPPSKPMKRSSGQRLPGIFKSKKNRTTE